MRRIRVASPAFCLIWMLCGLGSPLAAEDLGTIAGRVTDEESGQGFAAAIRISTLSPRAVLEEIFADGDGRYSVGGLPAGDLIVEAHHADYISEYFGGATYLSTDPEIVPVHVAAGQTTAGIDFALGRASRILVQLVAAENGEPLANPPESPCSLQVFTVRPGTYDPDLFLVYGCANDGSGVAYQLPPGTYYLATGDVWGRARAVYGAGSCNREMSYNSCLLDGATPIEVPRAADVSVVLPVQKSVGFAGRVRFVDPPELANPVARIRIFEETGKKVVDTFADPAASYAFAANGLAPGRYYLTVDGMGLWQSFAWPRVPCNRWYCDPLRGQPFDLAAGATADNLLVLLEPILPYDGCHGSASWLCLNQGRYRVEATWRDFGGASGTAQARQLTGETGYFYFFSPDNLEVMVKVLNGCEASLGHHFWLYGAGLTNVQVELRVTDTLTGEIQLYSNALGDVFQPILDSGAFATCEAAPDATATGAPAAAADPWATSDAELLATAAPAGFCTPEETAPGALCLGGRFRVAATWHTLFGYSGSGTARPITHETGTFSFFSPDNLELVVKVLDACHTASPGRWVFASGLTDVKVELDVEDLATGQRKTYRNDFGGFAPIFDLQAFPCD